MKNPTVESVLDIARQFAASSRIWDRVGKDGAKISDSPGRDEFRQGIQIAEIGHPDTCFEFAEKMARLRDVVQGGPVGIYGLRHLLAAIWYKAQGRTEDASRLLRIADRDLDKFA